MLTCHLLGSMQLCANRELMEVWATKIFTCPGVLLHTCSSDHRSRWWVGGSGAQPCRTLDPAPQWSACQQAPKPFSHLQKKTFLFFLFLNCYQINSEGEHVGEYFNCSYSWKARNSNPSNVFFSLSQFLNLIYTSKNTQFSDSQSAGPPWAQQALTRREFPPFIF